MKSISADSNVSAASAPLNNISDGALSGTSGSVSAERPDASPVPDGIIDGCSGKISWLWNKVKGKGPAFEYCCDEHDLFYDQGGGWRERLFADRLLRDCMLENLRRRKRPLHPAWIFFMAVRLCGWLYWKKCERA